MIMKKYSHIIPLASSTYIISQTHIPCYGCPIINHCPIKYLVPLIICIIVLKKFSKLITVSFRKASSISIFITMVLMIAIAPILLVNVTTGPDKLYVNPVHIEGSLGEVYTIDIRVVFMHKQPCPFPDWEITYKIHGDIKVIDESDTKLISSNEATKTIKILIMGNGTIEITYYYGKGCPFGNFEKTTVTVICKQKAKTTSAITSNATRIENTVIDIIKTLYNVRILVYITLFIIMILMTSLLLRKHSVSGSVQQLIETIRNIALVVSLLLLIVMPIIYNGTICPCPLSIPQYIILVLLKHVPFIFPFIALLAVVTSIIIRRSWCGWLCPLGYLQDLLSRVYGRAEIGSRYDKFLRVFKYVFLMLIIILVITTLSPWLCLNCFIKPVTQTLKWGFIDAVTIYMAIILFLIALIIMPMFVRRFFCKYICPTGALLEIISRFSLIRVTDFSKCRKCSICVAKINCPMASDDGLSECISCYRCIAKCPFRAIGLTTRFNIEGV